MIGILFGLISIVFVALTIYLKNEVFRNFFLLMTLLNVVVSIYAASYSREIEICTPEDSSSVCTKTVELVGVNEIMYGYSMVILAFFAIYFIKLLIKSASVALP